MKNHLKRIASPRTWVINRKQNTFITRPAPGGHSLDNGLPLVVLLRDILKLASTSREIQKILNNKEILIDGKRRKDHRFMTGLFDIITIPDLKKSYRVIIDNQGRLIVVEIPEKENGFKLCKVVGKTALGKGKIQFNLHDGKNVFSKTDAKVGDSFILTLPKLEVKEILPLKLGAQVFLSKGKHNGDVGTLKEMKGKDAVYEKEGKTVETAKAYLFVVGKDKPFFEIKN